MEKASILRSAGRHPWRATAITLIVLWVIVAAIQVMIVGQSHGHVNPPVRTHMGAGQ